MSTAAKTEASSERERILEGLAPLFEEAQRTGKWFHCGYQDLWFSPRELREQQAKGAFVWGAANWTLRDPRDREFE